MRTVTCALRSAARDTWDFNAKTQRRKDAEGSAPERHGERHPELCTLVPSGSSNDDSAPFSVRSRGVDPPGRSSDGGDKPRLYGLGGRLCHWERAASGGAGWSSLSRRSQRRSRKSKDPVASRSTYLVDTSCHDVGSRGHGILRLRPPALPGPSLRMTVCGADPFPYRRCDSLNTKLLCVFASLRLCVENRSHAHPRDWRLT